MLVLPDLSVTIWFGRRCCPLTRERCRVQPSHTGGCGTGVVPAYCDHGTPGGGGMLDPEVSVGKGGSALARHRLISR